MKLRIVRLLLFFLVTNAATVTGQQSRLATSTVRLRADASETSRVLTTVRRGDPVEVRACAVGWCWVEYRNKTGYIAERYLSNAVQLAPRREDRYTNASGAEVPTPKRSSGGPPTGATARCRDGTYSYSQSRSGTCSHHRGVAIWL